MLSFLPSPLSLPSSLSPPPPSRRPFVFGGRVRRDAALCNSSAGEAHAVYTIAPRRDSVPGGHASPECLLTCHVQVSAKPYYRHIIPRRSRLAPVLSCPVLSCLVLSCPVLSRPVPSCPVPSCPVLSCPVLPCPVVSCAVLSCPVLPCPALSHELVNTRYS